MARYLHIISIPLQKIIPHKLTLTVDIQSCGVRRLIIGKSSSERKRRTAILSGMRGEVFRKLLPSTAQDGGSNMRDSLSVIRVPAHARLIEANANDLIDGAFGRAATDLEPHFDVDGIIHAVTLVLEVGKRISKGLGCRGVFWREF